MRDAHDVRDELNGEATASLLEPYFDESEKRVWLAIEYSLSESWRDRRGDAP